MTGAAPASVTTCCVRSMAAKTGSPEIGNRHAFPANWPARAGWVVLAIYVVYAASTLDFTWSRFVSGLDNGARFIAKMFPPDFARWEILKKGLIESLEMAVLASF